jgi:hypothetical protein
MWFKIYWEDGTNSEHTSKILPHLGVVPEDQAPPTLMHKPDPITVLFAQTETQVNWSIRSIQDIQQRMEQLMPGSGNTARTIYHSLPRKHRISMTRQSPSWVITLLTTALNFTHIHTILDPWAENAAVSTGFKQLLSGTQRQPTITSNNRWGKAALTLEPLERFLYDKLIHTTGLSVVVTIPPIPLLDIALVTAMYFVDSLVCMYVPTSWISHATHSRLQLLHQHDRARTLLTITSSHDPSHCWVCLFCDADMLLTMLRPAVSYANSHVIVDLPHP